MTHVKKLEVCVSNVDLGSNLIWVRMTAEYPNVRLRRWGCLGYCHRCVHNPFVLIDDHVMLEAPDADALWQKVERYLAE